MRFVKKTNVVAKSPKPCDTCDAIIRKGETHENRVLQMDTSKKYMGFNMCKKCVDLDGLGKMSITDIIVRSVYRHADMEMEIPEDSGEEEQ